MIPIIDKYKFFFLFNIIGFYFFVSDNSITQSLLDIPWNK